MTLWSRGGDNCAKFRTVDNVRGNESGLRGGGVVHNSQGMGLVAALSIHQILEAGPEWGRTNPWKLRGFNNLETLSKFYFF